jgi:hypothetical protein
MFYELKTPRGTGIAMHSLRTKKVSTSGSSVRHLTTDIEARRRTKQKKNKKQKYK